MVSALLWFRILPQMLEERGMTADELPQMGRLVASLFVQLPLFFLIFGLLAAGAATRVAMGKDRATFMLTGGCLLAFLTLASSVNALYEPLLSEGNETSEARRESIVRKRRAGRRLIGRRGRRERSAPKKVSAILPT